MVEKLRWDGGFTSGFRVQGLFWNVGDLDRGAIRRRVIMVKLYRIVVCSRRSVHPSRSLSEVCAMQSAGITRRERIPEDSGPEPCGEKATAPAMSFYRSKSAAHCVSWNLTSSSATVDFTNLPMPTPSPKALGPMRL